jgi:hypothetical protein
MTMPRQKPHRSKQDYATPAVFIERLLLYLGAPFFQHDFAADAINSKGRTHYDALTDALKMTRADWRAAVGSEWGWLNPPFTNIGSWAERCMELMEDGGSIALLVPASIGSNWFKEFVYGHASIVALNGRLSFDGVGPYPKDCMLCCYGPKCERVFHVWSWNK